MSDTLTTFDIIAVTAVISALAAVVTVLWVAFKTQVDELKADRASDRAEILDLVGRVRDLERERLKEVKEYAAKVETMQRQQQNVFTRVVNVLQDIVAKLAMSTAEVDTEALLRNADKVSKARASENDEP